MGREKDKERRHRERQKRKLNTVKVRVDRQSVLNVQGIFADLIFASDGKSTRTKASGSRHLGSGRELVTNSKPAAASAFSSA